jgi:hypothetical protein
MLKIRGQAQEHWQVKYMIRLADRVINYYLEQVIRAKEPDEIAKGRWWVKVVEYWNYDCR